MIRVILTDDHRIIREGIKALLHGATDIQVVGEAANGQELINLLPAVEADVVLLDINMPIMDGFETTQYLVEHFPDVKVLVLSMLDQEGYVNNILNIGAAGYILKSASKEEICTAIQLVASGNRFISPKVAMDLLNKKQASANGEGSNGVALSTMLSGEHKELSKRELEVLGLIAEGYTNAEIAEKLFTSKRTIETHRQNLLEKTKMRNTATLIKYALQKGLIS